MNQKRMKEDDKNIDVKTKVSTTNMTNKDNEKVDSKVKHNETEYSKDKTTDYHESESFTITKPVDRIHTYSLIILGKKSKKHKKTQKNRK